MLQIAYVVSPVLYFRFGCGTYDAALGRGRAGPWDPHCWDPLAEPPLPYTRRPTPKQAPAPIIDPSCTTNPIEACQDDPQVKAALNRYYVDCVDSSRGALTIVCTDENTFSCSENKVRYDGSGCGSLAHEMLHAVDSCKDDDKCDMYNPQDRKPYCDHFMCSEARATTRASCCDPNNPWRQGRSWAECVAALRDWYVENAGSYGCQGVSETDRLAAWNECAPSTLDEATACDGTIPPIRSK